MKTYKFDYVLGLANEIVLKLLQEGWILDNNRASVSDEEFGLNLYKTERKQKRRIRVLIERESMYSKNLNNVKGFYQYYKDVHTDFYCFRVFESVRQDCSFTYNNDSIYYEEIFYVLGRGNYGRDNLIFVDDISIIRKENKKHLDRQDLRWQIKQMKDGSKVIDSIKYEKYLSLIRRRRGYKKAQVSDIEKIVVDKNGWYSVNFVRGFGKKDLVLGEKRGCKK